MAKPGPRNLITDVAGIRVGNTGDENAMTGTTVILPDHACLEEMLGRGSL